MAESSNSDYPRADADSAVRLVTVEPLFLERAAALAPAPGLGVRAAFLVQAGHSWRNAHNLRTVRKADDLFAAAAAYPDICELFPKGAEMVDAGIEIYFADGAKPCLVQLQPPHRWLVQQPDFTGRVLAFLVQRGFLQMSGTSSLPSSSAEEPSMS